MRIFVILPEPFISALMRSFALEKLSPRQVTSWPLNNLHIELLCEVDEQWSLSLIKKQQCCLWYAWEPRLKRIIAHTFGRRNKETLRQLLTLLSRFNVAFWCTDKFCAYEILPKQKHVANKFYTQRIERENLNLRNRLKRLNRKTLGYSKSAEMHDKIIGTFIEREHYLLWYSTHWIHDRIFNGTV